MTSWSHLQTLSAYSLWLFLWVSVSYYFLFLTVTGCCDFCANKHSTEDQKLWTYSSIWRHGTHAISYNFWDIKVPQVSWLLSRSSNPYFYGYSFFLLLCCCLHTIGWFYAGSLYSLYNLLTQLRQFQCEWIFGNPSYPGTGRVFWVMFCS